jgi:anti-sigma-K factor RskA
MNDQPNVSHEEWDELAAAYALDALEPAEEQRLIAHIATCDLCQHNLDDYTLVAAQLGSLADDEEPAPSWQRIRPKVIGDDTVDTVDTVGTAGTEPIQESAREQPTTAGRPQPVVTAPQSAPRPWRRPWVLATAAAVVLLIAGAVVGWQLGTRSHPASATAAISACHQQPGCRVVTLRNAQAGGGATAAGAVIVDAGRASMVPLEMAPAPAARMYVLWQMPRDGSPVAIVSFRQTDQQTPSKPLATAYRDTMAFAVSLEPSGPAPTRPSNILALGAASA